MKHCGNNMNSTKYFNCPNISGNDKDFSEQTSLQLESFEEQCLKGLKFETDFELRVGENILTSLLMKLFYKNK